MDKIDFVVTWVDGGDRNWIDKRNKFFKKSEVNKDMNNESRYRDFDIFKYWFRAVENYAPWVNKIYLIIDGQVPSWLNVKNDKLTVIDHKEYIPNEALPTFNSNSIEVNVHRIKGLSENFVLFNDDTILNNFVKETDFFKNGIPKDIYAESPIIATKDSIDHIMVNNVEIINEFFDKQLFYKKNFTKIFSPKVGSKLLRTIALAPSSKFVGFWNSHLPISYNKKTFETVWGKCEKELINTTNNKFRTPYDVSHWLMRYWQLASGNYSVGSRIGKVFDLSEQNIDEAVADIKNSKYKILCLNDNDNLKEYTQIKNKLKDVLKIKFKRKSKFEI